MTHAIIVAQTKLIISEEIPNADNPDQSDIYIQCVYVWYSSSCIFLNLDSYVCFWNLWMDRNQ